MRHLIQQRTQRDRVRIGTYRRLEPFARRFEPAGAAVEPRANQACDGEIRRGAQQFPCLVLGLIDAVESLERRNEVRSEFPRLRRVANGWKNWPDGRSRPKSPRKTAQVKVR